MSDVRTIERCEVCGSGALAPLLDLGAQPLCDDLVPIGSDARPAVYPIQLVGCPECITVHQAVQVEKHRLFPPTYHYRAALTQDVLNGMWELVGTVEERLGSLEGRRVFDIGCNDGSLLGIFRERGARTAGIEPTAAADEARERADWVYRGFFDRDSVAAYLDRHPKPDLITFTNVFAHIEKLDELLANLAATMDADTRLVIENHYLGAVVARSQFDTFYHEHPRTYSLRSFEVIAERLGRRIEWVEFPARYNGNIRVVIGNGAPAPRPQVDEAGLLDGVAAMAALIAPARERLHRRLAPFAEAGPLPAKAFPGRAAILVHCFGLDSSLVDATYERPGSPKIGHYVPGTRIEIRDETELFAGRGDSPAIVNFAWHIQAEIEAYLRRAGYRGEIVPVFQ